MRLERSWPQAVKSAEDVWCHMSLLSRSRPLFHLVQLRPHPQCPQFPSPLVPPPSKPPPAVASRPVMSSLASQDTTSTTSHHPHGNIHEEDWDRSESDIQLDADQRTPRNSVLFPADGRPDLSPGKGCRRGNRKLSELLKLYAEKGTDCQFSQEEATRIADVLGQWVRLIPSYLSPACRQNNPRNNPHC